jgi:biopolymer transport protein ExbD
VNLDLPAPKRRSVISLTPLIDVVFILLLFFMLASNFSQERSVAWATTSEGKGQAIDLALVPSQIYLQTAGQFVLDGSQVSQSVLIDTLKTRRSANPLHSAIVSVGKEVDVQTLLDLIASIKKTGVEKVVMSAAK